MAIAYVNLMGKCAEVEVDEYEKRDGTIARKVQVKLAVPSMRDLVMCEMPEDDAPPPQKLEAWEMEETWIVVQADTMRQLGFERKQARQGESAVGTMVIFQATEIREATTDERKQLLDHRKAQKIKAKQMRAKRQAAKKAALAAEKAPTEQAKQSSKVA